MAVLSEILKNHHVRCLHVRHGSVGLIEKPKDPRVCLFWEILGDTGPYPIQFAMSLKDLRDLVEEAECLLLHVGEPGTNAN